MPSFDQLPPDQRRRLCNEAQAKLGLHAVSVEKDFWVCWTLRELFQLPEWGAHFTFKGGTSLAKGWKLIERFSEDIDVVIERDFLGFGGDRGPEHAPSKKQQRARLAIRDFQRVSNRGAALFAEMNGLTQRARNGDFAAIFGQSGGLLNLTSGQKPHVIMSGESAAEKDGKFSTTQSCALPSETSTDERIFIPQEARGTPISTFEISVRLWHVLEYKQFRILGDIQGIPYDEFRQFRNCGKKTVTELRELVRQIQRAHPASRADGKAGEFQEPFRVLAGDCLNVPANVRDLKFRDLPVSVRLENVLEKRKAIQLPF